MTPSQMRDLAQFWADESVAEGGGDWPEAFLTARVLRVCASLVDAADTRSGTSDPDLITVSLCLQALAAIGPIPGDAR